MHFIISHGESKWLQAYQNIIMCCQVGDRKCPHIVLCIKMQITNVRDRKVFYLLFSTGLLLVSAQPSPYSCMFNQNTMAMSVMSYNQNNMSHSAMLF